MFLFPERPDGKEVNGQTENSRSDHAGCDGGEDAEVEFRGHGQTRERADHEHGAMGEGDDLENAEDEGEAEREEGVD